MTESALLPTYPAYPFPLVRGTGDRVYDNEGIEYLDFYGGHCVASTGHSHPRVTQALADQARTFLFYSTAARIQVREDAAAALLGWAPPEMGSVFFCNSGTEANENALKVSIKLSGRGKLAAFKSSFHGRTLLSLSVTDEPKLRKGYENVMVPTTFVEFGQDEALDAADFSEVSAVIVEPIQSMAGIRTASASWFARLRDKCSAAGALLIFDEVQTGFGRLGTRFAAQYYGVTPDIITCAKGIASGVPMGAVILSKELTPRLGLGDLGSTFGGGPLACAAMLATLEVIESERLMDRATLLEGRIRAGVGGTVVTEVLGAGLLLGLRVGEHAVALKAHLLSNRILVGGSGDPTVLRLMPPLVLSDSAVQSLLDAIRTFPKG